MSSSQLKEKLLLSVDPRPHWFWRNIFERGVSWRDIIGGALQHTMECNVSLPFSQEHIEDGEHLRMDNISNAYVGNSLSHAHHDGRFLPTTCLGPYGIKLILDKIAFQNPMKCKDKNLIWEDETNHDTHMKTHETILKLEYDTTITSLARLTTLPASGGGEMLPSSFLDP